MNIVHFEDEPWDSGMAHYALTLAAVQARRGHRVAVWGAEFSPVLATANALGLITRAMKPGLLRWANVPSLRRELASFRPQVINVHTGSTHALSFFVAPQTAAIVRTRADARPPKASAFSQLISTRTSALIAANSTIKKQLEAIYPSMRVHLIAQGIDAPPRTLPLPETPTLGIIARLDPVKGHEVLFEAAATLKPLTPDIKVLCAGDGRQKTRLLQTISERRLEKTATLLGQVKDKWSFISDCRIGIVASIDSEAVSRAALEWMAAGRPLVASRVGGLADIVEHGVTGLLVPPGDSEALAQAIEGLIKNPALVVQMGRAARARWEAIFSIEPFYNKTQDAYAEAIDHISR